MGAKFSKVEKGSDGFYTPGNICVGEVCTAKTDANKSDEVTKLYAQKFYRLSKPPTNPMLASMIPNDGTYWYISNTDEKTGEPLDGAKAHAAIYGVAGLSAADAQKYSETNLPAIPTDWCTPVEPCPSGGRCCSESTESSSGQKILYAFAVLFILLFVTFGLHLIWAAGI